MRAYLKKSVTASYDMVRDYCTAIAANKYLTYRCTTESVGVTMCYSPTTGKTKIFFFFRGKSTGVHSRTASNPATAMDTLTRLGIDDFSLLQLDKKELEIMNVGG